MSQIMKVQMIEVEFRPGLSPSALQHRAPKRTAVRALKEQCR
jgi:hypothetical protein